MAKVGQLQASLSQYLQKSKVYEKDRIITGIWALWWYNWLSCTTALFCALFGFLKHPIAVLGKMADCVGDITIYWDFD